MIDDVLIQDPWTSKLYTLNFDGTFRAIARGHDKTGGGNKSRMFDSISGYLTDIVLGGFDQDVSALVVGPKGSGKSSAVLSIDYHSAIKIAEWMNDGSKWTDYYNLEEYTAIILEEEATRLMNIQIKYIVKNFDDIGVGWGSRKWRDQENLDKNDIFQINRTDSAIQTFSVPNQFLLDKVPRSLVSHYMEMDQKLFEKGYTTIKLFKPRTMFREGKIINPYLQVDRNKFVNYLIPAPPHHLWTEYKKLRAHNKDIMIKHRNEEKKEREETMRMELELKKQRLSDKLGKTDPVEKGLTRIERTHELWRKWFEDNTQKIVDRAIEKETPLDKAMSWCLAQDGIGTNAKMYFRREQFIKKYNLDKMMKR